MMTMMFGLTGRGGVGVCAPAAAGLPPPRSSANNASIRFARGRVITGAGQGDCAGSTRRTPTPASTSAEPNVAVQGGAACPQAANVRLKTRQRVEDNAFHL